MDILFYIIVAIVSTQSALVWGSRIAVKIGLVDEPGGRKKHHDAVPMVGGIAIAIGFIFTLGMLPDSLNDFRSYMVASVILLVTGFLDDFKEMPAKTRLLMQLLASAIVVVMGNNMIIDVGDLIGYGNITLPVWAAIPFTVFAVTGMINALNMLDGLDGLSGGIGLIQIAACALLAFLGGQTTETRLLLLLATCLLTFLRYNFPWREHSLAQMFLGDVGSMFLGFSIAWFAIWIPEQSGYIPPTVMLWVLALPVADVVQVIAHRLYNGKSALEPDREHTHHILIKTGMSKRHTTYTLCALTVVCCFVGFCGEFALTSEKVLFFSFLGFLVFYCVSIYMFRRSINNEVIPWQT